MPQFLPIATFIANNRKCTLMENNFVDESFAWFAVRFRLTLASVVFGKTEKSIIFLCCLTFVSKRFACF